MEVYCASIERAVESWKIVQSDPNYYVTFGEALFRRIFQLEPSALKLFPFGEPKESGESSASEELSPRVYPHAKAVLTMLERALVAMLERQLHFLGEALSNLGLRHVVYGVVKEHFMVLEAAVLDTLEQFIGAGGWSTTLQKDWEGVLKFITKGMMVGAESGLSIRRKERELGELSVATLRLRPTGTTDAPALPGGRFDHLNNSSHKDPPKPAPRPKFDEILDECLPESLQKKENFSFPPPLPPAGRMRSEPMHRQSPDLPTKQIPQKNLVWMGPRRHTYADMRQKDNRLKFPKSPSPDPKSLLLHNDLFAIGLISPASKKKKFSRDWGASSPRSSSSRQITSVRKSRRPSGGKSSGQNNNNSDATTTTWPVLGLEPDATPVPPRRQVSPITRKKKKISKSPPPSHELLVNNNNNNSNNNSITSAIPVLQT